MRDESAELPVFLSELRARVSDKCVEVSGAPGEEEQTAAFREEGFTHVLLETLEDLGQIVGSEACFFEKIVGRAKVRVNGWYWDEEEAQLDIFATIFRDAEEALNLAKGDIQKAVRQAAHLLEAARRRFHEQLEPASDAYGMLQRIHEVQGLIERVRIVVLADGIAADPGSVELALEGVDFKIDVWDHRRLYRAQASGLPYEPIVIDLEERFGKALACLAVPSDCGDYEAYLLIIPGTVLFSLYHEFGSRLLELNVRSFLMLRGKVNSGIRKTILEEPERFMAYNNGLCLTAEAITLARRQDGGVAIKGIRGLQVVNGGQTVATIHRTAQIDLANLSRVFVQAKLAIIKPNKIDELVPIISRFANTQNKVNEADFSANSAYHVRLQQLSETIWCPGEATRWFYERARGQYQVARAREGTTPRRRDVFDARTPSKQKFDKVLLARYVNAWDQLPHIVGRGGQKNFASFTQRVFDQFGADWQPDADHYKQLVGRAIVYKAAERIARQHAFTGYRANAVAYTVALVSWRTAGRVDLMEVWNNQEVSPPLGAVLIDWMPMVHDALVETAGSRNVTEWCKKEECWRKIQSLNISLPRGFLDELAEGQPLPNVGARSGKEGALSDDDRENIARVMQIPHTKWVELVSWGGSGKLASWQLGIATTLASYAAMSWSKVPSAKQAKQGVRIIAAAEGDGVK